LYYTGLAALVLFTACNKDESPAANTGLSGSWRLVEVYDKSTSTAQATPPGIRRDVIITFSPGNKFEGQTVNNDLSSGSYTLPGNGKILFGDYATTKVMEDSWGGSFSVVLTACGLQSVRPCVPSSYSINGKSLKIISPLRYDITLEKL
jgi:hypothetical protein